MWGWIGSGCAQPVVIKEALKALADGQPRLIRISPTAEPERGIAEYAMTCHSGGALDIYIEPILPKPLIVILGRSPVAQALARLGKAIHYQISVLASDADPAQFPDADRLYADIDLREVKITRDTFIVVSTQGVGDEEALRRAAQTHADHVAFVASKAKAQKVLNYLRDTGVSSERLSRVRAPAGINIGAESPEEIAVSILAEIIQMRAARGKQAAEASESAASVSNESNDPVCGMQVNVNTAEFKSELQGSSVYFCSAACKQAFELSQGPLLCHSNRSRCAASISLR
jgi:xanthine dehydrogenase accessory factor